jgi:hypothetical protein
MSRFDCSRCPALALVFLVLVGCQPTASEQTTAVATAPLFVQPGEPLSDAEIEQFFRVVAKLPAQRVPEFVPAASDNDVDLGLPADELAAEFRRRFRSHFDAEKQGKLWAKDPVVAAAMADQHFTPSQFAALTASLSCAIARVRLDAQFDLAALRERGHAELKRLADDLADLSDDNAPATERDAIALRLGKTVALVEFLELVSQVPPRNCDLVRRHASRLVTLLPSRGTFGESFPKFEQWAAKRSPSAIQPASFEQPAR